MGLSAGLSIERSWVRIPPMQLQNWGKFIYLMLPKSLGMLLVLYIRKGSGSQTEGGLVDVATEPDCC